MRVLRPEDLWNLHRPGPPAPLGDGASAVVSVTVHPGEGPPAARLWRLHGDGSPALPLTPEDGSRCIEPAPSPDGSRVAFVHLPREPEGPVAPDPFRSAPQIRVVPAGGGEARRVADLPLGARDPRWLPDGRRLICRSDVYRDAPSLAETRARRAELGDRPAPRVTEDRIYRFWDRWLTGGEVPHLFLVDVDSGEVRDLVPDSRRWLDLMDPTGQYDVSPDGREVVFSADTSEPPHDELRYALWSVPVDGGEVRCLTADHPAHDRRPRYTPDGSRVVFGMTRRRDFYADRMRLAVIDRDGGEARVLTEEWDHPVSGWELSPDGTVVLEAEDRGRMHLWRLSLEGGSPERIAAGGTCLGPRPGANGGLWWLHSDLSTPPDVRYRPPNGAPTARLATPGSPTLEGIALGEVEELEIEGAGGRRVQALVIRPPGFDPSKRWPLVHLIHGGPHGTFGDTFHPRWNAQLFAAPGYVVAMTNFHGSSSFGTEFLESIHGRWGDQPATDVQAATDALLAKGYVDESRMAITGGSYGGYLTAWLATRTDRYRCGISHAGVFDLRSMSASDVTQGLRTSLGAEPWEDAEQVARYNPAAHVGEVSTPLLVLHGEGDYRVPFTQSLHLYGALRARGIEARLVIYPDESHWIQKRGNALHWWSEVLGWLERFLG